MKRFINTLLLMSLVSLGAIAKDEYEKYEKAINLAKDEASKALKTKNSKIISSAHYKLANIMVESREKGYVCDIAYLTDVIDSIEVAAENSDWFQKQLPTLPVYKKTAPESLEIQLIAAGLIKSKPMTQDMFVKTLQKIIKTSDVTLYKAHPGILPLGDIRFIKGEAIDTSLSFTEEGTVNEVVASPVRADVQLINKDITLFINGSPRYIMKVERMGIPVEKEIRSTDSIRILEIGSDGEFNKQLFLAPDECSA